MCKACSRLPKDERDAIEHEDEIFGYLKQSYISAKYLSRLRRLIQSQNDQIANLAGIVIEVAEVKPHKKRRLKELARRRPDLLDKLEETGLIMAHHY